MACLCYLTCYQLVCAPVLVAVVAAYWSHTQHRDPLQLLRSFYNSDAATTVMALGLGFETNRVQ